jgi:cytochrome c peroxidase
MKWSAALFVAAAIAGCKSKHDAAPAAQGSAPAPEAPKVRPSQEPLPQLPPLDMPADPKRAEKAELGHMLFFDKRLSANGVSCVSCHAGGAAVKPGSRRAPSLWNTAYFKGAWYWDGRAKTLEDTAKQEWTGNLGVGADNLDKKAAELAAIPGYKKLFEAAGFTEIKADQIAQALAAYERTLSCTDTAYDKFAAGDKTALTEPQQRGLDTFLAKGQCLVCHAPPYFSTAMGVDGGVYFNAGIGTAAPDDQVDVGRMKVTSSQRDWAAFKPPSLRNVTHSAPYFHDGSVASLDDAVKLMATGGIKNKNLNPILGDRGLTDAERADLVAFLGALDCPGTLAEPKLP